MAYARTSAGPAGRPGACISQIRFQILYKTSISRPFLFENRSLVDFQIGNEGHGGDLDENGCFTSRKCVLRWTAMDLEAISYLKWPFYLHKEFRAAGIRMGGDVDENGHFL